MEKNSTEDIHELMHMPIATEEESIAHNFIKFPPLRADGLTFTSALTGALRLYDAGGTKKSESRRIGHPSRKQSTDL